LVALAIGVPVVLLRWGHWPITGLPTGDELRDLPTTVVSETALFGVATVAVWAAWAAFMVAVVRETLAQVRGSVVAHTRLGPVQVLAGRLVGSIAIAISSFGTLGATPPSSASTLVRAIPTASGPAPLEAAAPSEFHPEASTPSSRASTPARATSITVQRGDTPWGLAARWLGDGARWREIFDLNRARTQPDGLNWSTENTRLVEGWELDLGDGSGQAHPSGAAVRPTVDVIVEPGENLWSITEKQVADDIGEPPDAATVGPVWLTTVDLNRDRVASGDPDVIYPGETVTVMRVDPTPPPSSDSDTVPTEGPTNAGRPAPTTSPMPTTVPEPIAPSPPQEPQPPSTPASTSPSVVEHANRDWPTGLAAGGLALAGVLLLLERRRRAQLRHRPRGQRIAPPEPSLQDVETALRAGSDPEVARLVDVALRAAAAGAGTTGLPPLLWVEAAPDHVLVVLGEPADAPPGFTNTGPDQWRTTASAGDLTSAAKAIPSPAPLLCPIGTTRDGVDLLIDLEADTLLTIAGDHEQRDALLHTIALAAATAPWNPDPHIFTVGMTEQLSALPGVRAASTFSLALDAAEAHAARIERSLTALHCPTTSQARTAGITPDAWDALLVISTRPPSELEARRLDALAVQPGQGFGVVCPALPSPSLGRRCVILTDGTIEIEGIDISTRAHQLAEQETQSAVQLLEAAQQKDTVPADRSEEPEVRTPGSDTGEVGGLDDLLTEVDVVARVLGEVGVVRRTSADEGDTWPEGWSRLTFERQKSLEALCYLALREATVDREDLEAALYPAGTNAQRTYHNAVTSLRRDIGEDLFPHPEAGRYDLSDRVVTDYGLFCELVAQAEETDDAGVADRLLADALDLVDGEPFVGPGRGYAWVGPHRGMIVAQVIDVAETLAETRLAADDWRGAEWAARRGLRSFPADERMHRLLMRAAHAAGNIPGVRRAYEELLTALADPDDGVEPDDTVHPETIHLLEQLTGRVRINQTSEDGTAPGWA
jgi:DNA-binding SARP family transcriptional activator/nucleoid-associated protein YgaU